MKELAGRVAVVTGAASGIGYALAHRFAEERMRVVLGGVWPTTQVLRSLPRKRAARATGRPSKRR